MATMATRASRLLAFAAAHGVVVLRLPNMPDGTAEVDGQHPSAGADAPFASPSVLMHPEVAAQAAALRRLFAQSMPLVVTATAKSLLHTIDAVFCHGRQNVPGSAVAGFLGLLAVHDWLASAEGLEHLVATAPLVETMQPNLRLRFLELYSLIWRAALIEDDAELGLDPHLPRLHGGASRRAGGQAESAAFSPHRCTRCTCLTVAHVAPRAYRARHWRKSAASPALPGDFPG